MKSVWVVESGEYEQRSVDYVAESVEAAVAAIKSAFGPPYVVKWDEPVKFSNDRWTLAGHFASVPGHSIKHIGEYSINRYDLLESRQATIAVAIEIMQTSLAEFGYQDRALSEGLDLSGEIARRIRERCDGDGGGS